MTFAFCFYVNGQDISFQRISTQNGLSQNDIRFVHQDSRGFMWIGTYDGLNRYDGYSFKVFRRGIGNKKTLGTNLVSCIFEDKSGNFWIGTDDDGLYYFDRENESFRSFKNTSENPDLLISNHITDIYLENETYLWAGTPFGLNRIKISTLFEGEPAVRHFFHNPQISSFQNRESRVWTITSDKLSNIWIGTPRGLIRFVAGDDFYSGEQFITYLDDYEPYSENYNGVVDIEVGSEGLFLALDGILHLDYHQINTTNPTFSRITEQNCNNILYDNDGNLWAGTNNGLFHYKMENNKVVSAQQFQNNWLDENSISKNIVTEIYRDNTNIIWIGTNGGGLNLYKPYRKKFHHFKKTQDPNSLSYNKIRGIYEDQFRNLWIGTEGGGLNFLSGSDPDNYESGFKHIEIHAAGMGENYAFLFAETVLTSTASKMWIGLGVPTALATADIYRTSFQNDIKLNGVDSISNAAFCFTPDKDGGMWVGTYGEGLYKYSISRQGDIQLDFHYKSNADNPASLSSNIIRSLLMDYDSTLWIGTDNGLNKLVSNEQGKADPEFIVFHHDENDPTSISHDYILPLFQSELGDLWIGTMGGGLNRFFFDKESKLDRFEAITIADGLPNNTIKGILEDENHQLWLSSNKGLTKYNPRSKRITNYDINDGLQDNEFSELACFKRKNGDMIFGGVNGFNVFAPEEIVVDMFETKIVFTELQVLNNVVDIGERINGRTLLTKSITETEKIELKYSERSFTISFAGLHFGAPLKNKYEYKLQGFDDEWIPTSADMRSARYTNLSPGEYEFIVKASNGDGAEASKAESLKITIITPIWQTKWAYAFYFAVLALILWFFRRYSIIAVREKNQLQMEHFEKEKIEELSQMKLRFFTNISHEFRTPLTLIIGPLEKLLERTKDFTSSELKNQYSIMYRNAKVLLNLINQLMDFRKLEQGKMKLKVAQRDVVEFIESIRSAFGELAKNKKIKLLFKSELIEPVIWFDADNLEKVLYNLLSNAFKYSTSGGKITISISDQQQKGHLQIRVSDTGTGIPKEIQEHLFERFYQGNKPAVKGIAGTGIGLSFVQGLVELHHGTIRFTSTEGTGTIFTILLPVSKDDYSIEEIDLDQTFIPPDESDINTWLDQESIDQDVDLIKKDKKFDARDRILIIEDNSDIRSYLRDSLSEHFNILEAGDGEEGLMISKEENPDLVISDVMMPRMDGFEYCEKMKSEDQTNHIPIILLTAKDTKEDQIKGYEFGADDYVAKPFNMNVLLARINGLLETRKRFHEKFKQTIDLDPSDAQITSIDQRFLNRLIGIIEEHISDPEFTVEKLAKEYGIAQVILNKKLKAIVNQTARAFIRSIRLKRAVQLLKKGRYSVADVTYEVGFSDLKYFRDCFKKEFSKTPSEFINNPD